MRSALFGPALLALLTCTCLSVQAADGGSPGGGVGSADQTGGDRSTGYVRHDQRDAIRRDGLADGDGASKGRAAGARGGSQASDSKARGSAPSSAPAQARRTGTVPGRNASAGSVASGVPGATAATAAPERQWTRPDADTAARRFDPITGAARGVTARAMSTGAIRPSTLRAAAGNGVVGGPQVARGNMVGGAANVPAKSRASIDASALHRRF